MHVKGGMNNGDKNYQCIKEEERKKDGQFIL